jgi:uncharacterized membrane protein YgdD (TMEM256/DUF423 family)
VVCNAFCANWAMTSGQASAKVSRNSVAQPLEAALFLSVAIGATSSVIVVSHTRLHALVETCRTGKDRKDDAEMTGLIERVIICLGGFFGAIGVATAAMASHGENPRNLAAISAICLAHGPALLAIGLARRGRGLEAAALVLSAGTLVFAGDLALREFAGQALFPGAAPLGGGAMLLGWAGVVAWGLFAKFGRN